MSTINLDEEIVPDADEVYDLDSFIYEALNAKPLPDVSFDVRQGCENCCGTTRQLHLEAEGIRFEFVDCCGNSPANFKITREYARLGHIERKKSCVCCRAVTWEGGGVSRN